MKKYEATVIEVGEMVEDLLQQKIVVLFDETAPKELREISIVHTGGILAREAEIGDIFTLGDNKYTITAIGDVVNKNLKKIGHSTLKFDGRATPELPGHIHLEGDNLPTIKPGDTIKILG